LIIDVFFFNNKDGGFFFYSKKIIFLVFNHIFSYLFLLKLKIRIWVSSSLWYILCKISIYFSLLCFVDFFFVFNRLLWRTWGTVETIWHEHGIWAVSWDVSACTLGACSTFRSKPTEWIWGTVEGWNGSIRMLVGWSRLEVLVLCFGVTMEANVWLQVVLLICSVLFSLWLC
jgi:hypothetical protein